MPGDTRKRYPAELKQRVSMSLEYEAVATPWFLVVIATLQLLEASFSSVADTEGWSGRCRGEVMAGEWQPPVKVPWVGDMPRASTAPT